MLSRRLQERLGAFDAVLAAAAISRGAEALVSADAAFAEVTGIEILGLGGRDLAGRVS